MHSDTESMLATVGQTLSHQLDTPSNILSFPKSGKKLTTQDQVVVTDMIQR